MQYVKIGRLQNACFIHFAVSFDYGGKSTVSYGAIRQNRKFAEFKALT